jgi:hypothetical protein|nr:MAG TPA: hypothetical protein [Caudoviricetes sp.]
MIATGFKIDSKTARKVFNGEFESLPLILVNSKLAFMIRKEELQKNYSRSEHIKRGDFNRLRKMEIIVKKIDNFERGEHIFSAFIMAKSSHNNKWYINGKQYCNSYMGVGTRFTFTDETVDEINYIYNREEE